MELSNKTTFMKIAALSAFVKTIHCLERGQTNNNNNNNNGNEMYDIRAQA